MPDLILTSVKLSDNEWDDDDNGVGYDSESSNFLLNRVLDLSLRFESG